MNKNYLPFLIPLIVFLAGLGFLGYAYFKNTSNKPGALQVSSKYNEAEVIFRGKSLGKTPVEVKGLKPGRGELVIKGQKYEIRKDIFITEGALTVVSADTGISEKFSANMTIWYDKNSGDDAKLFITSTPTKAKVKINEKEKGETPLTLSQKDIADLGEGLEYSVTIDKEGYENQVITLKLEKGYTLNISGNLFLNPLSKEPKKEIKNSYNLYTFKASDLKDTPNGSWASAISYYTNTRGTIQVQNETLGEFEYFVDSEGILFNKTGSIITNNVEKKESTKDKQINIAYLNLRTESNLTEKSLEALTKLFGTVEEKVEYTVKDTGLGYLNVRSTPNVSGEILGKINVGDKVSVVELEGDWYKITFNEKTGYVSAQYVLKVEPKEEETSKSEGAPKVSPTPKSNN